MSKNFLYIHLSQDRLYFLNLLLGPPHLSPPSTYTHTQEVKSGSEKSTVLNRLSN